MAYDQQLAERIGKALEKRKGITEKKMFGGVAFLLSGNMCCGVSGNDMIVRLAPDETASALAEPNTRVFDMTGRPMKGWIVVAANGLGTDAELRTWVDRSVKFASSLPPK